MAVLRVLAGALWLRLQRLTGTRRSDRLANDLRWIVHPRREDRMGELEARLICACAARKIVETLDEARLSALETALSEHARALEEFATHGLRDAISSLLSEGKSAYPAPSEALMRELQAVAPIITDCEEKVGGEGIEF